MAFSSHYILAPFGIGHDIEATATRFWMPRVAGAPLGVAVWGALGFFNGIGRPRTTVVITLIITCVNVILNRLFIFDLGLGRRRLRLGVDLRTGRRPGQHAGGISVGPLPARIPHAPDVAPARVGAVGAVSPGVSDGTDGGLGPDRHFAVPADAGAPGRRRRRGDPAGHGLDGHRLYAGRGVAQAGTTLVGQSIGAGNRAWAMRVGTYVMFMAAILMGGIGVLLALAGPWVLPLLLTGGGSGHGGGAARGRDAAVVRRGLPVL